MEQTLYADILFLIDFSIDFLCLVFSGRLCGRRLKLHRLCISAALGALYSVTVVIIILSTVPKILTAVFVAFIMCLTAFEKKALSCVPVFIFFNFAVSGGITALLGIFNNIENKIDSIIITEQASITFALPSYILLLCALVSGLFAVYCGIRISGRSGIKKVRLQICFKKDTTAFSYDGLVDSGNSLREPFTALPCIIVKASAVNEALPIDINSYISSGLGTKGEKIFVLPCNTVGNDTLLYAVKPFFLTVDGVEKSALVAIDTSDGDFNGFYALVPTELA